MSLKASLRRADLHYGNGVQLHTAASGSVGELQALYLCLDDGQHQAVGEVRINITYLNGFTPDEVIAQALQALSALLGSRTLSSCWQRCRNGQPR